MKIGNAALAKRKIVRKDGVPAPTSSNALASPANNPINIEFAFNVILRCPAFLMAVRGNMYRTKSPGPNMGFKITFMSPPHKR
mmetsp:Transcript_5548/g.7283  ORF Transcript_5548/g.7283 Transcript_5548/m.7283 type:complete len:83 (+) Transcript_5548:337-585(+)